MPVGRPSPEYMDRVVEGMRETLRARSATAPEPVNFAATAALEERVPLVWDGVTHHVRTIGYLEGLTLQHRMMRAEKYAKQPAADEDEVAAHLELVREIVDQFWTFLDPMPATNPFTGLAPLEVGAIAGFFFTCLQIQNHPSRAAATLPSRTTTSTH